MTLHQYDGWDVAEVVRRNSHELTAMHLLQARDYICEERQRRDAEFARLADYIDETARIGHRVLEAKKKGRKTVRIEDVAS